MSRMSELDIIRKDAEYNARCCLGKGEKIEDISEAIFSHLFNCVGQDVELKEWATNSSSDIIRKLLKERGVTDQIERAAPQLYIALRQLVDYHADDPDFYKDDNDGVLGGIIGDAYNALGIADGNGK